MQQKKRMSRCSWRFLKAGTRTLAVVALLELVDATLCVDEALCTCVKWVRSSRDFEQDERILLSVIKCDRLFTGHRGTRHDQMTA